MTLPALHPGPIQIRRALGEGWRCFQLAPWSFVGFTLLAGGSTVLGQSLHRVGADALAAEEAVPLALLASAAGLTLGLVGSLWLNVGLVRGAWIGLAGDRPRFSDLARWDGRAILRLLLIVLLLLLINVLVLVIAGLGSGLLTLLQPLLGLLPALAGGAVFAYIAVNQLLHLPLAVLGGTGPVDNFRSGRVAIDPHWGRGLAFSLVLGLILVAGALALLAGLLVALPLVNCSLAAAYRQLFGPEDRSGLLTYRGQP